MACLEHLSIIIAIQSAINEQLKDLTHIFSLNFMLQTILRRLVLLFSHIKTHVSFWDEF
jgi:hypothetical protein